MDWLERMTQAITYIEENLDGEIDLAHVGKIVCCSPYHFQRVFATMANITLSDYIRRRRLACAARELQQGDARVIDLALKYGYNSPTAFNRAFQAMQGITPSEAKKPGVPIKAYPPISFQITIKGAVEMDYRIVKMESFRVVGYHMTTTMEDGKCFQQIPAFWGECNQKGMTMKLPPIMDGEPKGVMGLNVADPTSGNPEFSYYIAVASGQAAPEGMCDYTVPAATWAVFKCIGPMPTAIQETGKRVMTEWLPTSGYEIGIGPDIERYGDGDTTADDYECEIWMPVVSKQ